MPTSILNFLHIFTCLFALFHETCAIPIQNKLIAADENFLWFHIFSSIYRFIIKAFSLLQLLIFGFTHLSIAFRNGIIELSIEA